MSTKLLWLSLPALLLTSCFQGDNASNTDGANDAAGTGSPNLAKEVVGVWQLSTDQRFGYDEPCNMLDQGLIEGMFDIGLTEEMTTLDYPNGCQFKWKDGTVSVAFGGPKPYPSMYHAEYIFDKMYQGGAGQVSGQMGMAAEKEPISGPETRGTGAERPATEPAGGAEADMDDDSTASNDSSNSTSGVTSVAAQFTKPAVSTGRFVAVPGVGDKAVWDPARKAMHVLYNNHIVNVTVQTKANAATSQQKATSLAEVVLSHFVEASSN
ncbi:MULTISPECIES: hypothetical protein [Spirosoma]|uniref:Uncharacterized protein n=1 Tax=Spirosoma sordidisoli TaxID=2502893 RepID=A0A4V1RWH8_9BACT|nr:MULTISPECIES: hypothetical protein [Spirosoma]RYC70318.1 hypothetical protein EQG79_10675 [Spirosoma sordidisoli]